jgi:opacity protein-like surface antigen
MRRLSFVVLVLAMVLTIFSTAFAQDDYDQDKKGEVRLKIGYPWPQSPYDGRFTLGAEYWTDQDIYGSLGFTSVKWDTSVSDPIPVHISVKSWKLTVGKIKRFDQGLYAGAGIGFNKATASVHVEDVSDSDSDSHFVWEVFGGKEINEKLFVQVRYQDGGFKPTKLIALEVGTRL